ncbi:cation-binding protein [bacterium]|jgi:hemerythrin-like domain-containing protein|nr:cation-binding protein [bacterium]
MTEISSALMREHQLILKTNQLMNHCANLSQSGNHNFPILEVGVSFVDFIRTFADQFHHAKEEEILFKFLNLEGVLTHCNPVTQMLHEHELGRSLVLRMENAIQAKDEGEFIEAMTGYVSLLSDHIFKENNILYPMAESSLNEEQKNSIVKQYGLAEERLNAGEVWKKYERFSSELEEMLSTAQNQSPNSMG